MARLKKLSSAAIEKAKGRLANLKAIDTALDLGNSLTVAAYDQRIKDAEATQQSYNDKLAEADELMDSFDGAEKDLNDLSERMLDGVSVKYGKDSDEYKTAGGTKKSERARPVKKAVSTPDK
jgi:hypothetical protein